MRNGDPFTEINNNADTLLIVSLLRTDVVVMLIREKPRSVSKELIGMVFVFLSIKG